MRRRLAQLHDPRGERGGVLVIVAFALIALFGFSAFVLDVGSAYMQKRRLQAAADLGALSASQKLPNAANARTEGAAFTRTNWNTRSATTITTNVTTGCKVAGCTTPDKVTVDATTDVPTTFAKVFGIDNIKVKVHAAACSPCDTSVKKFDVMVVLDRSGSMCDTKDSNGCVDLNGAKAGIRSLLGFFDPTTDRVGLATLSSGDPTASGYPCEKSDNANFMTTKGNWVIRPLSNDFKNPNGSLNAASPLVQAVDDGCLQAKSNTPIAPAIQDATAELEKNGRHDADVTPVIVFLGDGGANIQPMKGSGSSWQFSWYHPAYGNPNDATNIYPCRDAIARAGIAKAAGVEVYVLGYDLAAKAAQACNIGNHAGSSESRYLDGQYDAEATMKTMATDSDHFFQAATPGEITTAFNKIGHQITLGGNRLVE